MTLFHTDKEEKVFFVLCELADSPPTHARAMLYFERQQDQLCGVHALNALLQGPFFTAVDLSGIACELDDLERSLIGSEPNAASENVAADGNFSIQVLTKALLDVFSLRVNSMNHPSEVETWQKPELETGFLLNLEHHWFCLRRLRRDDVDTWWNLNSLLPGPRKIGSFYLTAFLEQLKAEGYSIFVVRDLHAAQLPSMFGQESPTGRWFTEDEAMKVSAEADAAQRSGRTRLAMESAMRTVNQGGTLVASGGADVVDLTGEDASRDPELRAALEASMGEYREKMSGASDADLNATIAASLSDMDGASGGAASHGEDDSLAKAIAASLEDGDESSMQMAINASLLDQNGTAIEGNFQKEVEAEPEAGNDTVTLAFRLPSGERVTRRFTTTATIGDVENFVQSSCQIDMVSNCLALAFPARVLSDRHARICDSALADREVLTIQARR